MYDVIYDAAFYRKQAESARQCAANASTCKRRELFLKLAAEWDRLADVAEDSTADKEAMEQLMHSIAKA
jgi:hypothetical protein